MYLMTIFDQLNSHNLEKLFEFREHGGEKIHKKKLLMSDFKCLETVPFVSPTDGSPRRASNRDLLIMLPHLVLHKPEKDLLSHFSQP